MKLPLAIGQALDVLLLDEVAPALALETHLALCRISKLEQRGKTALEWAPDAIAGGEDAGANLAVRQSPLLPGVHQVGQSALAGLPGWLADSLPDSWGRLLVDRQLRSVGIDPRALSGVDRLAVVGARGPGALAYRPSYSLGEDGDGHAIDAAGVDLDGIARDAELLLSGDSPEVLDHLVELGGSAGGSRPKAWIAVDDETGAIRSGAAELRPGETGWLVKFRAPNHDPEDIGLLELAYAHMARRAGLDVAEPRLFETAKGKYFASRRFDRASGDGDGGGRRHVLTAAGLLDVPHDQAIAADYADLLKLTRHITRSEAEVEAAFRHAAFNVLAHNRDDHLKQYAFVRAAGRWRRSPAYDLTYSEGPGGEHTLLVAGEGRRPTEEHLREVAARCAIDARRVRTIVDEVRDAVAGWGRIAEQVGVSSASSRLVAAALEAGEGC